MSAHFDQRGLPITRDQLSSICETLGYDPRDVRSIRFTGTGPVVVEVFLRLPTSGLGAGVRFQDSPGGKFVRARITHPVRLGPTDDDSDKDY